MNKNLINKIKNEKINYIVEWWERFLFFEINIVSFGYREGGRIATAGFLQGSAPQTFT